MLTYPKATIRVRRMPMHLSSSYVTLMPRKFYSSFNFPPIGLKAPNGLTLGFGLNFYVVYVLLQIFCLTRDLRDASADRREILHGDHP